MVLAQGQGADWHRSGCLLFALEVEVITQGREGSAVLCAVLIQGWGTNGGEAGWFVPTKAVCNGGWSGEGGRSALSQKKTKTHPMQTCTSKAMWTVAMGLGEAVVWGRSRQAGA